MPALPYIGAAVSMAGGVQQNQQANEAMKAANRDQKWQKYLDELNINQKYESAKNWEAEKMPELTWDQSVQQAEAQLNPLYQDQMTKTLENQANANKARGFYGQLPGDLLMQDRAAEVEKARLGAVGNMANQLQQASQMRADQNKRFGVSQFGTYGTVSSPTAVGSGNMSSEGLTKADVRDITKKTMLDPSGILTGNK